MINNPKGEKILLLPNGFDALGIPDMFNNKTYVVTYCIKNSDGTHTIHCLNGMEFTVPAYITVIENIK